MQLHIIAQTGSPEEIHSEWEAGQYPSIDILDSEGRTPLQNAAAFNGNPESIRLLVDLGASLEAGAAGNITPWHLAKMNSSLSSEDKGVVLGLLQSGE